MKRKRHKKKKLVWINYNVFGLSRKMCCVIVNNFKQVPLTVNQLLINQKSWYNFFQ